MPLSNSPHRIFFSSMNDCRTSASSRPLRRNGLPGPVRIPEAAKHGAYLGVILVQSAKPSPSACGATRQALEPTRRLQFPIGCDSKRPSGSHRRDDGDCIIGRRRRSVAEEPQFATASRTGSPHPSIGVAIGAATGGLAIAEQSCRP